MAISINGIPVAGNGKNGKDATINGVNALTLKATGGLTGQQSGDTYTIDGSGLFPKTGGELSGNITVTPDEFVLSNKNGKASIHIETVSEDISFINMVSRKGQDDANIAINPGALEFRVFTGASSPSLSLDSRGVRIESQKVEISPGDGSQPELVATQKYVDDLVGNINTLLDEINGVVI